MTDKNKTAEQLASDFVAMGHSEQLITNVIAGNEMADESAEDKKDAVKRNVEHLEQKKVEKTVLDDTVSVWTDEDFTAIDAAIEAGNTYIADQELKMNFKINKEDYDSDKLSNNGKLYLNKLQHINLKEQQLTLEAQDLNVLKNHYVDLLKLELPKKELPKKELPKKNIKK